MNSIFKAALIAAFALGALGFTSCEGGDDPQNDPIEIPEADKTQTAFADQDTTGEFTFTATDDWSIDVDAVVGSRASNVPWIRLYLDGVETYSGPAGEFTLDVVLDENYSGEDRKAQILISGGGEHVAVQVTQEGTAEDGSVPEKPGEPEDAAAKALLTAHEWHLVKYMESIPGEEDYVDTDPSVLTFNQDGTTTTVPAEGYFNGAKYKIFAEGLLVVTYKDSEGDDVNTDFTITTLTDEDLEMTSTVPGVITTTIVMSKTAPIVYPVTPEDMDAMAVLASHPWKQVSAEIVVTDVVPGNDSYTDRYQEIDATVAFNTDETIFADGPDRDIFNDYFGFDPTYFVSNGSLVLRITDENAMIPGPTLARFYITTLTDETFEFTGDYTVNQGTGSEHTITLYQITMVFEK